VAEARLLSENPWQQFTWIEGVNRPIRQFNDEELLSLLDYLDTHWSGVPISAALAKVLLWSWGRKREIMGLRWDSLRLCGNEVHFEIIGKRGVEKWFRIPEGLHEELLGFRTASPFVFADHNRQLRAHHRARAHPTDAELVSPEFSLDNLGKWFERRLADWSKTLPRGKATIHVFRKTSLQYARRGEDVNRQVARDACVGTGVMMRHYVKETDPERRGASNRTYHRIAASLSPDTARRYGYLTAVRSRTELESDLQEAVQAKHWERAAQLCAELAARPS
jgi:hypothetical protein